MSASLFRLWLSPTDSRNILTLSLSLSSHLISKTAIRLKYGLRNSIGSDRRFSLGNKLNSKNGYSITMNVDGYGKLTLQIPASTAADALHSRSHSDASGISNSNSSCNTHTS